MKNKSNIWKVVTVITAIMLGTMRVTLACAIILLCTGCSSKEDIDQVSSEQVVYEIEDKVEQPTLNSVVNHPVVGDERNFMFIQEIPEDGQLDFHLTHDNEPVKIEPGKTYCVLIFLRNDATFNTQADKERLVGPPLDILVNIPETINPTSQDNYMLCAIRRSALLKNEEHNVHPDINTIGCNVKLYADKPVKLMYNIQGKLEIRFGKEYKDVISNEYYVYTPEEQETPTRPVLTSVLPMGIYPSEEGSFLIWSFWADSTK